MDARTPPRVVPCGYCGGHGEVRIGIETDMSVGGVWDVMGECPRCYGSGDEVLEPETVQADELAPLHPALAGIHHAAVEMVSAAGAFIFAGGVIAALACVGRF